MDVVYWLHFLALCSCFAQLGYAMLFVAGLLVCLLLLYAGLFAASLQLLSLSLLFEWLVLLLFCSLMFSLVAWMVGGRLDAALCSLVCWTFCLWYVVDCLGAVEGPPGFSLAWFTLHHLYRMLLLLTAGVGLLELLFTLLLLNG
jgi:hypothetical protein